jgi:hypothetical protein
MKKIIFGFVVLSLLVLTACTDGFNYSDNDLFNSNEEIISFQAFAAASFLGDVSNETLNANDGNTLLSVPLETVEETEEVEDTEEPSNPLILSIEPYIELAEKFLGNDNGLSVNMGLSDMEDYELMMTFQTKGLLGETQSYTIHYNMTIIEEEDDETEFSLVGIMVVGDQIYQLTGEREVEEDEDKIEFIAKLDDLNYFESEYKVESSETEFEIKVVKNGETVLETSIEIEIEEDETKISFEFYDNGNEGTYEFKYEFEGEQQVLKIEYDVTFDGIESEGEVTVAVMVDEVTGETTYKLYVDPDDDDAYEDELDRDVDDDDDDEEDEDDDDDEEDDEE